MRPTRRGWALAGVIVLATWMAWTYGPRGLNAIVAPGVVALVAAAWQVHRFAPPTMTREHPMRGERGETVRVRLDFETDTPGSATVVESFGDGLSATGNVWDRSLGDTTLAYDLHLDERGERTLGPTTVEVRDVFGLFRRRLGYGETGQILVHPRVHLLAGPKRAALAPLHGGVGDDRQAVDGLRRYRRGDPLRDVHWKSSAKQPDEELVVKKFATEERTRSVEIAAAAAEGRADPMAEATASIAAVLLESGSRVGVSTPSGRVAPDHPDGFRAILDHLARVGAGSPSGGTRREVDVLVEASGDGVDVTIDGRTHDFSDIAGEAPARADADDERGARAREVVA